MSATVSFRSTREDGSLPDIHQDKKNRSSESKKLSDHDARSDSENRSVVMFRSVLPAIPGAQSVPSASRELSGTTKLPQEKDTNVNMMFSPPEAQAVLSVLDETALKLNLVSHLSTEFLNENDVESFDPEVATALKEHFEVERRYMELVQSAEYQNEKDQHAALYQELDLCLGDSTRTVARLLKQNPELVKRMKELSGSRSSGTLELINTFSRLRKLVGAKLRMSAEDEKAMKEQLRALIAKEQEDNRRYIELSQRLNAEKQEHIATLSAKDKKIERLQQQIEQLTQKAEADRGSFDAKMKAAADAAEAAFRTSEKELSKQLEQLQAQLARQAEEHRNVEHKLHNRKHMRSSEVGNTVSRYDEDMTEKHEALEQLKRTHESESRELAELQAYFQQVDAEAARRAEEHQNIRAMRDSEVRAERRVHDAAMLVQKLYAQFFERAQAKKKKPKSATKKEGAEGSRAASRAKTR